MMVHVEQKKNMQKKIIFKSPVLPGYLENIQIDHLKLGEEYASFELHRYKGSTGIIVKEKPQDWEIYIIK